MELEQEIKKLVKDEVEKLLHPLIENIADYAAENQKNYLELKGQLEDIIKETQQALDKINASMKATVDTIPMIAGRKAPDKKPVAVAEKPSVQTEEPEEENNNGPDMIELAWVKEQDGNIEKGETQIWRYGNHTLTVWMDGKKNLAQIDDEEPVELWNQKALEKIQKKIEKMPQE